MTAARPLALLLALAAVPAVATAQTKELKKLHVLIIGDQQDPEQKVSVDADITRMTDLFVRTVPADRLHIEIEDGAVSPTDVTAKLNKLAVTPDDALLVYFSGHGAQEGNRLFLALGYRHGQPVNDKFKVYRDTLLAQMTAKKAGLTVLVTDCCSNRIHKPKADEDEKRKAPTSRDARVLAKTLHPTVRKLFFQTRGLADMTAATNDEAYSLPRCGGFYTCSFATVLLEKRPQSWKDFQELVRVETESIYLEGQKRGILPDDATKDVPQSPKAYSLPGVAEPVVAQPKPVVAQPKSAAQKTWAAITLVNRTDKPVPMKYRWTTEGPRMTEVTVPAGKEVPLSIEVQAGKPFPKFAFSMADGEGERDAKEFKGANKPTAADGKRLAVSLP